VPLHTDTRRPEARHGESPQAAARRVRYDYLAEVAETVDANRIATGHHADDLAESLVMRLINGAGSGGLAGMARRRKPLIRPLLELRKDDLIAYATEHNITFAHDRSNQSPRYLRNRIRAEVMPLLERFNPNLVATLTRQAELLADEEAFMAACAADVAATLVSHHVNHHLDDGDTTPVHLIGREGLSALAPALSRRVVRQVLLEALPTPPETSHVEAVRALANGAAGRRIDLPGGLQAVAGYGTIRIATPEAKEETPTMPVLTPGITPIPWAGVRLEVNTDPTRLKEGGGWLLLRSDQLPGPLTVRTRQNGDRFCPHGMGGHSKKLKTFLIDRKVPRDARDTVPLLCAGDEIIWVLGLRTDERWSVKQPGPGVVGIRLMADSS